MRDISYGEYVFERRYHMFVNRDLTNIVLIQTEHFSKFIVGI